MRLLVALGLLVIVGLAACAPAAPDGIPSSLPARILEPWVLVSDTLEAGELAHEWRIHGEAGEKALIDVTSNSALDVVLTDEQGVALGQGMPLNVVLPATGTYRVVVASRSPADYQIALAFSNRPTPTPTDTPTLTPSATITPSPTSVKTNTPTPTNTPVSTLTPSATPTPVYAPLGDLRGELLVDMPFTDSFISSFERHVFLFEGRAGQYARVAMDGQGEVDAALAMFAPDGRLIAMDDDSGGDRDALLNGIRLEQDGTYIVQAANGGGPGPYSLVMSLSDSLPAAVPATPAPTAVLPVGLVTPAPFDGVELVDHVPVLGRLDAPGDVARFTIGLNAGDVFSVAAQSANSAALLPRIQMVNPAGEIMFETGLLAEAGGALLPALGVIESGVYSVFVSGDRGTFGDFVLAYGLGQSHTDVLRGDAPADTAIEGGLGQRGLRDVWSAELAQGARVRVTLAPLVGGFAPSLALVAPDGTTLVSAEAERGAPNPELELDVPASGRYRLEVTGGSALTYGPYRLEWTRVSEGPQATEVPAAVTVLTAFDTLAAGEYRDYVFQGGTGERFRLRVLALSAGLDPVAALIGPDGSTVAQADDSPGGSLNPDTEVTLPASGSLHLAREWL